MLRRENHFAGDFVLVDGKVWRHCNVKHRKYRFRMVNGRGTRVYTLALNNGASFVQFCLSDFNCNGAATVQNIFDFLAGFFASDPRADANRNGAVTVQDIFDFLSSFFASCSPAQARPALASFRMIPAGFP